MAERDLIRQLDQAADALLAGSTPQAGPEVTELLTIASWVRDLPAAEFKAALRSELMTEIERSRNMSTTVTQPKPTWTPAGFHTLTPYLLVADAAAQIEFLKRVFGAEEMGRYPAPDGSRIMHAEVKLGDSVIEMGEPPKPDQRPTPLHVYVPDVDAVYARGLEAGAKSLYPPSDHEYGERGASFADAEGNHWYLATAKGAHYIPEGLHSVNIYLSPRNAPTLIDFLKAAFGAEEIARHEAGGHVVHAKLRFGDSVLEMGEAHGQWQPMPCAIHYYVPNVNEAYARAIAAGGESISAPADQAYGERSGGIRDPHGNTWYVATRL